MHNLYVINPHFSRRQLYAVIGYAVTTTAEFALVDQAARIFEQISGCSLHRNPVPGKCKVLPLGRWRTSLQQEDIAFPYLKLCDTLSRVGVELTPAGRQQGS